MSFDAEEEKEEEQRDRERERERERERDGERSFQLGTLPFARYETGSCCST